MMSRNRRNKAVKEIIEGKKTYEDWSNWVIFDIKTGKIIRNREKDNLAAKADNNLFFLTTGFYPVFDVWNNYRGYYSPKLGFSKVREN